MLGMHARITGGKETYTYYRGKRDPTIGTILCVCMRERVIKFILRIQDPSVLVSTQECVHPSDTQRGGACRLPHQASTTRHTAYTDLS